MKVIYIGDAERVHVPGVGKFPPGEPIDVPDEVGKALIKQDQWETPQVKTKKDES